MKKLEEALEKVKKPVFRVDPILHAHLDEKDVPGYVSTFDLLVEEYNIRPSKSLFIDKRIHEFHEMLDQGKYNKALWVLISIVKTFSGYEFFGGKKLIKRINSKIDEMVEKIKKGQDIMPFEVLEFYSLVMLYLNKGFNYMAQKGYNVISRERVMSILKSEFAEEEQELEEEYNKSLEEEYKEELESMKNEKKVDEFEDIQDESGSEAEEESDEWW